MLFPAVLYADDTVICRVLFYPVYGQTTVPTWPITVEEHLSSVLEETCIKQKGFINNLEKRDPSEIERTYFIRKQQTRFHLVCL